MAKEVHDESTANLPEAPPGFRQADTDVDAYPAWDFDRSGELRGKVVKVKTITLLRRGEESDVRMAIVETQDLQRYCLWESANLGGFFDEIQAEMEIVVQPAGAQSLSGGRSMKVYRAFYR